MKLVVSNIKPCRNLVGAIRYIRDEKAHREGGERYLSGGGNGVSLNNAEYEMMRTIERHGRKDKVRAYSMIISFSKEELGDSYEDVDKADKIVREFLKETYGEDRQWFYALQNDGKSGCTHAHVVICNTSLTTGRSIPHENLYWRSFKNDLTRVMERNGVEDVLKDLSARRELMLERYKGEGRETRSERALKDKGEYVWKNDLKGRILKGLEDHRPTDWGELIEAIKAEGVTAEISKSRGKNAYHKLDENGQPDTQGYIIKYQFTDEDGKTRKSRGVTLGNEFSLDVLDVVVEGNRQATYQADEFDELDGLDEIDLNFGLDLKTDEVMTNGDRLFKETTTTDTTVSEGSDEPSDEFGGDSEGFTPRTRESRQRRNKTPSRRNFSHERTEFENAERIRISQEKAEWEREQKRRLDAIARLNAETRRARIQRESSDIGYGDDTRDTEDYGIEF